MAYARKVGTDKLKTFSDFVAVLWKTISFLSKDAQCTDTVFDLYLENSIKYGERTGRQKATAIDAIIENDNQPLPATTESFWVSSLNKKNLQTFFVNWLIKSYKDDKPLYLGGFLPSDLTGCIQIISGVSNAWRALQCDHERADERILFHINHAIQTEHYTKIVVAATDTDIFISLLYHYHQWVYANLKEMCVLYGQGLSTRALSIPKISDMLESYVFSVLPAVHTLSGCDSTSKIGGKKTAMKVVESGFAESLSEFGK